MPFDHRKPTRQWRKTAGPGCGSEAPAIWTLMGSALLAACGGGGGGGGARSVAVTNPPAKGNTAPMVNAITQAITYADTVATDSSASFAGSTGTFTATDPDAGDIQTFTVVLGSVAAVADTSMTGYTHRVEGMYSTLYYANTDGAGINGGDWKMLAKAEAINALGATQAGLTDTYTVTANDGTANAANSRNLVVTVNGVNDAPTLDYGTGGANDGVTTVLVPLAAGAQAANPSGTLVFGDADGDGTLIVNAGAAGAVTEAAIIGPTLTNGFTGNAGMATVTGTYGTFTLGRINPDSGNGTLTWAYNLDEGNAAVAGLLPGNSLYEKLYMVVNDGTVNSDSDPGTPSDQALEVLLTIKPLFNINPDAGARASVTLNGVKFEAIGSGTAANDYIFYFSTAVPPETANIRITGITIWVTSLPQSRAPADVHALVDGSPVLDDVLSATVVGTAARPVAGWMWALFPQGAGFGGGTDVADRVSVKGATGADARGYLAATGALAAFSGGTATNALNEQYAITGLYGTLTLDRDGDWTYRLDNSNPAVAALTASGRLKDPVAYTYTVGGNDFTGVLDIHVLGSAAANTAPTLAYAAGRPTDGERTVAKTETGTVSGIFDFDDADSVDGNDALLFKTGTTSGRVEPEAVGSGVLARAEAGEVPEDVAGMYGTFGFTRSNADGELEWSYDLDQGDPAVSGLYEGQRLYDKLTVSVSDDIGDSGALTAVVRIDGSGPKPASLPNAPPTIHYATSRHADGGAILNEDSTAVVELAFVLGDIDTSSVGFHYEIALVDELRAPLAAGSPSFATVRSGSAPPTVNLEDDFWEVPVGVFGFSLQNNRLTLRGDITETSFAIQTLEHLTLYKNQ